MLRYHASFENACGTARCVSLSDHCAMHVDKTDSGLFYISDWFTAQTITSFHSGIEHKREIDQGAQA